MQSRAPFAPTPGLVAQTTNRYPCCISSWQSNDTGAFRCVCDDTLTLTKSPAAHGYSLSPNPVSNTVMTVDCSVRGATVCPTERQPRPHMRLVFIPWLSLILQAINERKRHNDHTGYQLSPEEWPWTLPTLSASSAVARSVVGCWAFPKWIPLRIATFRAEMLSGLPPASHYHTSSNHAGVSSCPDPTIALTTIEPEPRTCSTISVLI